MDLEKKFIEMRNIISKDIESIRTDEEKKQFAEKYGFSSEEVEVAIRKHKEWRDAVKASDGVKRSSFNNMSGVDYSSDLNYTEKEVRRNNYQFMESIKKQSFKSIVSEISPDKITPELIEILRQNGYDGKFGHPVLQSYFQMYCRVQEAESKVKGTEGDVYRLQRALEDKNDEIKALRTREDYFINVINNQGKDIATIRRSLESMFTKLTGLKDRLKPKSFIEKVKGLFTRKKQKALPEPSQVCDEIREDSRTAMYDCDRSKNYTEPLSVEELKKQNARARLKSKERVIEMGFKEDLNWGIDK